MVFLLVSAVATSMAAPAPADTWPWGMKAATFFAPLRLKITEEELENRIGFLQRLGYDTLVIGVQHFPLDYISEWPALVERSARIAAVAHRHGMKVIEHHSAGVFHTDHLDDSWNGHPLRELSPVNAKTGEADRYIETMIFACPNNPLHWQVYSEYARRLMIEAQVDAYMADDVEILNDTCSCACRYCREAFHRRYGVELPPADDRGFWGNYENPHFRQWLRFRQQSVGGFHRRMRELRDAVAPEVKLLTCQCQPAGTGLPVLWALAHDEIAPDLDVLFLEAGNAFGYTTDWAFHASDLKLLQAMGHGRKPVFPLYYPQSPKKPYLVTFSSPEALKRFRPEGPEGRYENEVGKATGAYERAAYADPRSEPGADELFFLWAFSRLFADGWWVGDNFDLAAEGFAFEQARARSRSHEDFGRTGSLATIALHYSRQTRDFYGGLGDSFHVDEWRGWAMTLLQRNWPFEVVLDEDLENPLPSPVRLLILPNSACLSDEQMAQIRQFVRRGGRLIATGDTSLYTADGTRRSDFALADVFGAHYQATRRGATGEVAWDDGTFIGQKGKEGKEGERGEGRGSGVGADGTIVPDYKLADDVTLVRLAAGEQALGTIRGQDFEGPAGVLARSGQSLYLSAKAGLLGSPQRPARLSSSPPYEGGDRGGVRWLGPRDVGWQRIVANSVRWGVQDNFPVRLVNAPPGLILAAARSGTDVVAQLLHAPVKSVDEVYDPNACSFTLPKLKGGRLPELRLRSSQRPIRVTLRSPDLSEPATLTVLRRGAEWSVALPPKALRRYAVVVWEVNE